MDLFEWNKVAGAILGPLLLLLVLNHLGSAIVLPTVTPGETAYIVEIPEAETDAPGDDMDTPSIASRLAAASVGAGERKFRVCSACHTTSEGGANLSGPNLRDVVGGAKASKDFPYSDALAALGGTWGHEELDAFLAAPRAYVPGTKMSFAGLKNPEDRANIIAWLRLQSASPPPLQ